MSDVVDYAEVPYLQEILNYLPIDPADEEEGDPPAERVGEGEAGGQPEDRRDREARHHDAQRAAPARDRASRRRAGTGDDRIADIARLSVPGSCGWATR